LTVFFTPSSIVPDTTATDDVYIIIDVIRATTSLAAIFDQGAARVLISDTVEQARQATQLLTGSLLCGERNVQPLPGFDYGNSPTQFSQLDLTGRELILTTTNGTRAFYACPETAPRLAGCFYNAQAVTSQALKLAYERNSNLAIVCAGEFDYFALDDASCAGYLALELQRQHAENFYDQPLLLHESANAAITLYQAYPPPILINYCRSAQSVILGGLPDDPPFCMQTSRSESVPIAVGRDEETGLLMLKRM
jgi:2-phosphosulfolactate phosphatase